MSAILTLILKFAPLLLQILTVIFGGAAAVSFDHLYGGDGGAAAVMSSAGVQFVGGNAAVAAGSLWLSRWVEAFRISRDRTRLDWGAVFRSLGSLNALGLVRFLVRVAQLVKADPEASRLFEELFGRSSSSVPVSEDVLLKALVERID